MKMRPAHSRFYEGTPVWKGEHFDRVVTTCWEIQGNVLKYAAAVFRRESKNAKWDKKLHRETAIQRFNETPIRVELSFGGSKEVDLTKLNGHAMDWYIATVLLPTFGGTSRFAKKHHHVSYPSHFNGEYHWVSFPSYSYFNDQYTFFKEKESISDKTNRETIRVKEPQQCKCEICFANRKTDLGTPSIFLELSSVTTGDLVTVGVVLAGIASLVLYLL